MGLFGGSSKSTTTNQTEVYNTNVQDTEGVTLANSSGNQINISDMGAIARAFDFGGDVSRLGSDALSAGSRAFQEAGDLAGRGLDNALDFGLTAQRSAFDFGRAALSSSDKANTNVLTIARDANASVFDSLVEGFDFGRSAIAEVADSSSGAIAAVGDAQKGILDFARGIFGDVVAANKDTVESNLTGLNSIAKQTSASSDDRVSKIAGYALLAVAAAFIAPALIGKFK